MSFDPAEHFLKMPHREKDPNTGHYRTVYRDYLEVKWRLVWFRDRFPHGTVRTKELMIDLDVGYAMFRAVVTDGEGGVGTGHGIDWRKTMPPGLEEEFMERAETRAIGRALAALGCGTEFAGLEMSEGGHVSESPVSPAVQKAMERHERKLGPVTEAPAVDAGLDDVTADQHREEPAAVTSQGAKKPRDRGYTDTHAKMERTELLHAIRTQLHRLADNPDDAESYVKQVCGTSVDLSMWPKQPDNTLRRMLAKLEPMPKDAPPAVPSGASSAAVGDVGGTAQEAPTHPPHANGDSGPIPQGEISAPGDSTINDQNGGNTGSKAEDSRSTTELLDALNEDSPLYEDEKGYASVKCLNQLEAWALSKGELETFVSHKMSCPREKVTNRWLMTQGKFERCINAVNYMAQERAKAGYHDNPFASTKEGV